MLGSKSGTLEPLESLSMTDRVETSLREYFEKNAFKPGDPLPNENEIAQQLNVSRNVVREALSRFRMLGMVEARPRRGMVMAEPDVLGGIERVLNPFILSQENLKDIFELRLILEMGISELLFARKSPEEIEALEGIVAKQANLANLTKEDEIEFHGKLYEMTGNETFKRFQTLLFPVFDYVFTEFYGQGESQKILNPVSHSDLVSILKEGNADTFRKAMFAHLAPYYNSIFES